MKKTVVSNFVVLILVLLFSATTARAKAERMALSGTEDIFIVWVPGRMWQLV